MAKKKTTKEVVKEISKTSKSKVKKNKSGLKLIKTGITLLDLVLNDGIPLGRIINIVGDKSSGKTYLAIEIIAYLHKIYGKKLKWYYDDCEGGFSFDTDEMYGFEMIRENQSPSITVEEMATKLHNEVKSLKKEEILVFVVDTLDGLSSEAERKRDKERQKALEEGKDRDKGTYAMEKQKFMSEFFRLRAGEIKNKNIVLIVISQVRQNIGVMFGEKYTRTGGKALDFYAWAALWLAETEKTKKKDRPIGITIKAKTKKIKAKKPFRECLINLIFDYGVDDVSSNIDFLYDLKTPTGKQKPKAKLNWEGKEYARKMLIKHIESNDLEEKLIQKVTEKWDEIEDSISSEERNKKW